MWRLPPMNGEAEADALVVRQRVLTWCVQFIGDEQQPFLRRSSQLFGCPPRIACA